MCALEPALCFDSIAIIMVPPPCPPPNSFGGILLCFSVLLVIDIRACAPGPAPCFDSIANSPPLALLSLTLLPTVSAGYGLVFFSLPHSRQGVCAQTHAVFRQARAERMRPLLVLNKVNQFLTILPDSQADVL